MPGSRRWHWGLLVARSAGDGTPAFSTREERPFITHTFL